jgi:hypothetical protein
MCYEISPKHKVTTCDPMFGDTMILLLLSDAPSPNRARWIERRAKLVNVVVDPKGD